MFSLIYNLLTRSVIVLLLSLLVVNYLPNELFNDFPFDPKPRQAIDYDSVAPKEWNTLLSDTPVEFIRLNQLVGPESLAISQDGLVYTGLADGRLVELNPKKDYQERQVLRFRENFGCQDNVALQPPECGRFLQLRFFNNTLYAIEAGTGLYSIDIKTGKKKFLGPNPPLSKPVLYNSFAFDPKEPNLVYISVSSTKWDLQNIIWSIIELESSGQLIALDISTGKRVVVANQLMLANGIDIDAKRERLLISETTKSQVSSISLASIRDAFRRAKDGDKAIAPVEKVPLISVVPGNPDNIIVQGDLAYIALPFPKPNGRELIDHLATMPTVRKAIGRVQFAVGKALQYVHKNFYQDPLLKVAYLELMSGHLIYRVMNPDQSAVLEYNLATGSSRLLGSKGFSFVSEAVPENGHLLLGSFRSPFIVRTKI